VAGDAFLPTSYSTELLTQPAEWLRRWWLRRRLAVLFRLEGKVPRLSEYRELVTRLWGKQIHDQVLSEIVAHGTRLARLSDK
jgi:hypothetical protein